MPTYTSAKDLEGGIDVRPQFSSDGAVVDIPRRRMSESSVDPDTAYAVINDELMLDGHARLNVATFGTTWMEPQAEQLMADAADKNLVDRDEYPRTAELEDRCLDIIADFWNAPEPDNPIGCSTIGSSEGCMLAGMALKRRWAERRREAGKSTDRPNLIVGANVQVCWHKFCRYWEVEPKEVTIRKGETTMHPDDVAAACDENTIGVVAILGSTFDGAYEDIAGMSQALDKLETETGLYVPIHVDAASGGLFAPFVDPELVWDFRIERVQSINASGHKYGLVYPGVGWVLWRNEEARPEELVFRVDYLGGDHPTMSLNFTKPGSAVVAQYYQFVRLGYDGFKRVHTHSREIAQTMAEAIGDMDEFELIADGSDLPVVTFCFNGANTKSGKPRKGSYAEKVGFKLQDIADSMKQGGWAVPAYHFCADREELEIIRIVIRNAFSRDLAQMFLMELGRAVGRCDGTGEDPGRPFRH
ncbi:glutamate decarboxylase [Thermoleophilia bacterium SCSIO 60948]|nr:glutamate decarboxylase [Thermoleophilia bacterium SCSIO 60948]